MTDNEIIKALECCSQKICKHCPDFSEDIECSEKIIKKGVDLITRQQAEIDKLKIELKAMRGAANSLKIHYEEVQSEINKLNAENMLTMSERNAFRNSFYELSKQLKTAKSEAVKEFADKVDEILKRYAHLHKYADEARNKKDEYADGTPMEMVSVWEVLSLKKWEMCDYETMNTLQDNIENIAKERILTELEKDFMLLKKELVGD